MSGELPSEEIPLLNVAVVDGAVFRREAPALRVFHDHDGDWQFLCSEPPNVSDAHVLGLGEMLQRDRTLRELLDMREGFVATRNAWGEPWQITAYDGTALH